MKFESLKKDKNSYYSTDVVSNDKYLDFITNVFTDNISFSIDILESLKSLIRRGITVLSNAFRNGKIEFGFTLQRIQTAFSVLGLEHNFS
ncbi:hypothetical protein Noda2021_04060 [Candidatus Dependentiae bacterium Noda2021]|nr:hypothetical protein Noda2021_04060 [Candidatus Dependentiae bacterium Noda2021]